MGKMSLALILAVSVQSVFAVNKAPIKKNLSTEQVHAIQARHQYLNQMASPMAGGPLAPVRPYSELENAGYLFFSSGFDFESRKAKIAMAKNLPADVTLVVFADPMESKSDILADFAGVIEQSRIRVIELNHAEDGFWARDSLPIPVWGPKQQFEMVDAKYFYNFEPDQVLANRFNTPLLKLNYNFEGGNFIVNDKGDCLTVDNDLSSSIPTEEFKSTYGCQRTIRLPYEKGIGHADESVRFIKSNLVATDHEPYARILRAAGFEVILLPRPDEEYETYVNSLLVNGTIYVPIFDEQNDAKVIAAYQQMGFNVVPIETRALSNDGLGSLHCITMTYPPQPLAQVLQAIGAHERYD